MRQPQSWLLALLSVLALMSTAATASAEEKIFGGHVEVGATGINTKDNAARVNEYVRGRSEDGLSFAPKLFVEGDLGEHSAFELEADANGPRDQQFNMELDAGRIFRLGFDYQVLEHWKDHETLDQMGATGRDDVLGAQPSVTTDKIMADLDAAGHNIYPLPPGVSGVTGVGGGTLPVGYDPLQAYTEELSNDYLVTRRELKSEAALVIPALPNVIFHAGMRIEKRQGMEQAIGMTKCDSCHVSAVDKKIDEVTEDYTFGATGKFGLLTVDYEYLTRTFSESGSTPSRYYEDAQNATAYNMLYEYGDYPFGRTPDSEKDSHALKARIDLPKDTSLTASYIKSDIESSKDQTQGEYLLLDGSTLKSEYESVGTKLAGKIGKNLRLSLRGSMYDIDVNGNEIYYPARDAANAAAAWPETNTDAWHSAEARKVKEVGTDLVYRLARGTTLRLGYEFEEVDRDEEELLETDTQTLKASVKTRLNKTLSGNLSYQFQKIDEPLPGAEVGIAQGDGIQDPLGSGLWYYNTADFRNPAFFTPTPPPNANPNPAIHFTSTPTWYWTDVYPNRQLESTSLPDEVHEAKLSTTWAISANKAATFFARVRQAENDEVEFEQTTYVPGVSLWYAPNGKMNLTMAYTFNKQETENQMCVGWYHG